mmetsp:Transcript_15975/g.41058  ORF Transcript_15975/g.41058 Transcript_15975/m.41058 type:complete len:244 (+) Transcript_15975:574-1305(+)
MVSTRCLVRSSSLLSPATSSSSSSSPTFFSTAFLASSSALSLRSSSFSLSSASRRSRSMSRSRSTFAIRFFSASSRSAFSSAARRLASAAAFSVAFCCSAFFSSIRPLRSSAARCSSLASSLARWTARSRHCATRRSRSMSPTSTPESASIFATVVRRRARTESWPRMPAVAKSPDSKRMHLFWWSKRIESARVLSASSAVFSRSARLTNDDSFSTSERCITSYTRPSCCSSRNAATFRSGSE